MDYRLKFKLTEALNAFAVVKPYDGDRWDGLVVVATIVDTLRRRWRIASRGSLRCR